METQCDCFLKSAGTREGVKYYLRLEDFCSLAASELDDFCFDELWMKPKYILLLREYFYKGLLPFQVLFSF